MAEVQESPRRHGPLPEEPVQEGSAPPALGSPHDGYAALLLTLALSVLYFGCGFVRLLHASNDAYWWIALVWFPVALAVVLPAYSYFQRAHGLKRRSGFPALPAFSMYFAFGALVMFLLPVLADAADTWWSFGMFCVILAALSMGPTQLILSKDPNRHSELTA